MLKKIVSLVVGATLVLATLGVSAATVGTVSTYEGENIKVTTTVTNTGADDVYTYLAYQKGASVDNLQNAQVVYVDEKTPAAAGEDVVFEYTTLAANNEAVILVGGAEEDPVQNTIQANVYKDYSVQVDSAGAVEKKLDVTNVTSSSLVTIAADLANVVISGVTLNGDAFDDYVATDNGLMISYSAIENLENVAFAITTTTGAVATAVTIWNGAYIANEDGIIAVAQVEGDSADFGITFSDGAAQEFKGAAKGVGTDGMYAIRLNNIKGSMFKDAAKVYVSAYADEVVSEDSLEIVIAAE